MSVVMANPRIEEVDDDAADPDEMDLDAFDFARPQQGSLQPSATPPQSSMDPAMIQQILQAQSQQQPGGSGPGRPAAQQMSDKGRMAMERERHERTKHFQCIYPVYFDSTRSREQGRRVKKEHAVSNPLASEIAEALKHIGNKDQVPLQIVFEPHKSHPKDWSNPGRVRVLVKKDGEAVNAKIHNKHQLYEMIATYLKAHPTTEEMTMKYMFPGMRPPQEALPPPAIPRGFKIGRILPMHSPALSGGGVSDNFFKDMMAEMGGQLPPGMEGMAGAMGGVGGGGGGGQKKIKDKKKK